MVAVGPLDVEVFAVVIFVQVDGVDGDVAVAEGESCQQFVFGAVFVLIDVFVHRLVGEEAV